MKLTIIGMSKDPYTIYAVGEDGSRWFWGCEVDGEWDKKWVCESTGCDNEPNAPSLEIDDGRRCKPHGEWDCQCEDIAHRK